VQVESDYPRCAPAAAHSRRHCSGTASVSKNNLAESGEGRSRRPGRNIRQGALRSGLVEKIAQLADPANDGVGLRLEEEQLPQRTRRKRASHRVAVEEGVLAYVDLVGAPHPVGRLWTRAREKKESALFEYDPARL
jgi:hypothetical protein